MSLVAALLIVAQSAAPLVGDAAANRAAGGAADRARPVAVQVRASARIIRPVRIDTSNGLQTTQQRSNAQANGIQRTRDKAGTLWVEFN